MVNTELSPVFVLFFLNYSSFELLLLNKCKFKNRTFVDAVICKISNMPDRKVHKTSAKKSSKQFGPVHVAFFYTRDCPNSWIKVLTISQ